MSNVKIENIVRKLFAKATDPSIGEAEAALYMNKVSELLNEYNLSEEILHSKKEEDILIDEDLVIFPYYTSAYGSLAVATARLFFCEVYRTKTDNKQKKIVTPYGIRYAQVDAFSFIGKEHNRKVAMSMFDFFVKTIKRMASKYTDNQTERNRFAVGASYRLCQRIALLIKQNQDAPIVGGKNLPALIKNEAEANRKYMEEQHNNLRKGRRGRSVTYTDAVKAGSEAANSINLNTQVSSGQKYEMIG